MYHDTQLFPILYMQTFLILLTHCQVKAEYPPPINALMPVSLAFRSLGDKQVPLYVPKRQSYFKCTYITNFHLKQSSWFFNWFRNKDPRFRETAQSAKCLPYKHEDSIYSKNSQKPGMVVRDPWSMLVSHILVSRPYLKTPIMYTTLSWDCRRGSG